MKRDCYVAFEFDGVLVTHNYPKCGDDIGAVPWLQAAAALGAKLILLTSRSGELREVAEDWAKAHGLEVWAVNINLDQEKWSDSSKVYAHVYIDDCAIGAPLKLEKTRARRKFLDWDQAGPQLLRRVAGILNQ